MINNDQQLTDTILEVKKYLLGKIQDEMDSAPTEKLRKGKMVIAMKVGKGSEEGSMEEDTPDDWPEAECDTKGPSSELDRIKALLMGKMKGSEESMEDEEEMSGPDEEESDDDLMKIKKAMMLRKQGKM